MTDALTTDPGNYRCSIDDVIFELRKYKYEDIYDLIAQSMVEFNTNNSIGFPQINVSSLSTLATLLVEANSKGINSITKSEFIELNKMTNSLENVLSKRFKTPLDIEGYILNLSHSQFIFNHRFNVYRISNNWTLFYKNPESSDTEEAFGKLERILDMHSRTYEELSNLYRINSKYNRGENTIQSFNVFRDFPILKVGKMYICPFVSFLADKLSEQIFYSINTHYAEIEKMKNPKNPNPHDNEFSQYFGIVLEKLLLNFIQNIYPGDRSLGEFKFGKENKASADAHLYQKHHLYLFQLKNKRPIIKTQLGSFNDYKKDIEAAIIKPYIQSLTLISNPAYLEELRKRMGFHQIQKIYLISIYPEEFHNLNFPIIRTYINERLEEEKGKYKVQYPFEEFYTSIIPLQLACEYTAYRNEPLYKIINKYKTYIDPKETNNPLRGKGDNSNIFISNFDDFVSLKLENSKSQMIVKEVWDDFSNTVIDIYRKDVRVE